MKALIIEDDKVAQLWKQLLEGFGVEAIVAETLEQALELVRAQAWKDFSEDNRVIVFMDGRLNSGEFNTLPVLAEIPDGPGIKKFACSGEPGLRILLMQNGCTHDSGGKENVPAIIVQFVQNQQFAQAA